MSRSLPLFTLAIVALSSLASGCAHTVRIDSAPGADIYVDGQHIGTAPATYNETSGFKSTVHVTAKKGGVENTVAVERTNVNLGAVGAGTVGGVGACCAITSVAAVASLFFVPCALLGAVGWGVALGGPLAGWLWFGNTLPDAVTVPLSDSSYSHTEFVDERRRDANY